MQCDVRFSSRCFHALITIPTHSGQHITEYKDQTDVFYASPLMYLQDRFPPKVDPTFPPSPCPFSPPGNESSKAAWKHEWPQYLVSFGALLEEQPIEQLLTELGYNVVWHRETGFEGDPRRRGGISVMSVRPAVAPST